MSAKDTNVGKRTEQAVALWLRANGFPGAERTVKTGYRVNGREVADLGDITGTPSICWQVKSLRVNDPRTPGGDPCTGYERAVPGWMAETEAQRIASGSDLGFLVVRRWGTTDVGRWWVFQTAWQLYRLLDLNAHPGDADSSDPGRLIPVRMDMAALSGLLQLTGWAGAEPTEEVS